MIINNNKNNNKNICYPTHMQCGYITCVYIHLCTIIDVYARRYIQLYAGKYSYIQTEFFMTSA